MLLGQTSLEQVDIYMEIEHIEIVSFKTVHPLAVYPAGLHTLCSLKDMYENVLRTSIYNSPKLGPTQMFINNRMGKYGFIIQQ